MANSKNNLKDAIDAVNSNLANLERNVDYTLEQLTGAKFWASLSSGKRKGLGIQFKAYTAQGGVPVVWTGSTSSHKQLYQLT
jgi:hypothetical protein